MGKRLPQLNYSFAYFVSRFSNLSAAFTWLIIKLGKHLMRQTLIAIFPFAQARNNIVKSKRIHLPSLWSLISLTSFFKMFSSTKIELINTILHRVGILKLLHSLLGVMVIVLGKRIGEMCSNLWRGRLYFTLGFGKA